MSSYERCHLCRGDVIWSHSLRGCDEGVEWHRRVTAFTATSSFQEQGSGVDRVVPGRVCDRVSAAEWALVAFFPLWLNFTSQGTFSGEVKGSWRQPKRFRCHLPDSTANDYFPLIRIIFFLWTVVTQLCGVITYSSQTSSKWIERVRDMAKWCWVNWGEADWVHVQSPTGNLS